MSIPNRQNAGSNCGTRWSASSLKIATPNSFDAHNALYRKAAEMMRPDVRAAFDLSTESDKVRRQYGTGVFGQGCLLARRLVERGVPFVEVALGDGLGWDTHQDNFRRVKTLSEELDAGWATLMTELQDRGLLESTTILWISEFGRTPVINPSRRPRSFSGGLVVRLRRRRHPRRPGVRHARAPMARPWKINRSPSATCWQPCVPPWACRPITKTSRPRTVPLKLPKATQFKISWPDRSRSARVAMLSFACCDISQF